MKSDEPTDQLRSVLGQRLKAARGRAKLSQRALGMAAGIDEGGAAVRINRYEQGVHSPDVLTITRIGKVLGVPAAYFYCDCNELAAVVIAFHRADRRTQELVVQALSANMPEPDLGRL